jgi:tRNA threonylcarbamoyladenosine biosynthesis protein TsaE
VAASGLEVVTRSEEETLELGRRLGESLIAPVWVGLEGELGAGKTRLVQGIARGLGYRGRVRSPTFVLENRYPARVPILHQDLYRLEDPGEDLLASWDEHEGVVLVEWSDRAQTRPERWVRVRLESRGETVRAIEITWAAGEAVLRPDLLGAGSAP